MSRDLRNEFMDEVKLILMGQPDSELIISQICVALDRYELSERNTDLVPVDDENVQLIKMYTSAILVDGKAKSTINQYLRELKLFISYFPGQNIKDLKTFDIRSYLAKRKQGGLSNRSLENVRAYVRAFYDWLTAEEIIPKNPCAAIKPIKHSKELPLPYTTIEIDRIRNACKNARERAIVEVLLASGVRVAEFCDLDVEDINFAEGKVRVRHGKGDKERYTFINDLAKEHLLKYLDGRTSGPLIMSQRKERYTKGGVRNVMRTLGARAGVDDVHPHRFRRTFATTLASRGMPLQQIQKLMGHSNINTTMLYVTLTDAETKYAYKKYA